MTIFILFFLQIAIFLPHSTCGDRNDENDQVLVISISSFRWDFIYRIRNLTRDLGRPSYLWNLIDEGSYAPKGIATVFTSERMPNEYTLVTGLFEESHGVVSNDMIIDPKTNRTANLNSWKADDDWVLGGEPIWTTLANQANSSMTGCMGWFGCKVSNTTFLPTMAQSTNTLKNQIETAIYWLDRGVPLFLISYQNLDYLLKMDGPESAEVDQELMNIDASFSGLTRDRYNRTNIVILSDHGISGTNTTGAVLKSTDLPRSYGRVRSQDAAVWMVDPHEGAEDQVVTFFQKYQQLRVYKKDALPENWHFKNNDRIAPIVVVAEPGYTLKDGSKGMHGYPPDIRDMRAVFVGRGPAFQANATVPDEMSIVDVYGLLCLFLNITAAPNNGTVTHFEQFLTPLYIERLQGQIDNFASFVAVIVLAIALLLGVLIIGWLCHTSDICKSNESDEREEPKDAERTPLIRKDSQTQVF